MYSTLSDATRAAYAAAQDASARGARPVLLVPTVAAVYATRHMLAQEAIGFSVEVDTPQGWARHLWQLFGDGRTLVNATQRKAALYALAPGVLGEKATEGMMRLLEGAARAATCFAGQPADLLGAEVAVASVLQAYRTALASRELVEACEAYMLLAEADVFAGQAGTWAPVALDLQDANTPVALMRLLQAAQTQFFDSDFSEAEPCTERANELISFLNMLYARTAEEAPLHPEGAVQLALSAGPTATHVALYSAIVAQATRGARTIAVALPNPYAFCHARADALAAAGCTVECKASIPLQGTATGAALAALATLLHAPQETPLGHAGVLAAADLAANPLAGIDPANAFAAARTWRQDRLVTPASVLATLHEKASVAFSEVVSALTTDDTSSAVAALAACVQGTFAANPARASLEAAACTAFAQTTQAAAEWHTPWHEALAQLANTKLTATLAWSVPPDTQPRATVTVATLGHIATLPTGSFDAVVLGQLNAESYPVRPPEDALHTLLKKWHAAPHINALGSARRTFARAINTAHTTAVLHRTLHTESSDDAQPSIAFEEALACYKTNPATAEGINKTTGVPESLLPNTWVQGEQHLLQNASNTGAQPPAGTTLPAPHAGHVSAANQELVVLPRAYGKHTYPGLDVSASQIESYIECPYQWFAKRRMRLEALDEGFGPVERGTFLHSVLEDFYTRFIAEVAPKVTTRTLDAARHILQEVFEEAAAHQINGARPGNRYAPADAWEAATQRNLLPRFMRWLEWECTFLPGFTPQHMEWSYGDDAPFTYAGCNLVGRIDRIDADAAGNAIIIDYKSSLTPAYKLFDPKKPTDALPDKIQALIYAKAVRDLSSLRVVGTLYVNPLKREVYGAFDRTVVGPEQIPFRTQSAAEACGVPADGVAASFDELIDRTEAQVAEAMAGLANGDVAPRPKAPSACEYCPVGNCEARLAARRV